MPKHLPIITYTWIYFQMIRFQYILLNMYFYNSRSPNFIFNVPEAAGGNLT